MEHREPLHIEGGLERRTLEAVGTVNTRVSTA